MNKDQEDDEPFMADANIPTFAEAVQERDEQIAELKKRGDRDRADRLAQCRRRALDDFDCGNGLSCRGREFLKQSRLRDGRLHETGVYNKSRAESRDS